MSLDSSLLWAFLVVFVRASAMLFASPVFGAQSTPLQVRVLTTLSIAAALTMAIKPNVPPMPEEMWTFAGVMANEVLAGVMIGLTVSFVFFCLQMAGNFLDFQIGLGSSQILNPATGVPVTLIAQMKFMLALVTFLSMNGHHSMIRAFVESYSALPALGFGAIGSVQDTLLPLVGRLSLLALQIAAPVAAVCLIVDAGLGLVNKAVPQMQVLVVGMPAKLILGFIALGVTLPAIVTGVDNGVQMGLDAVYHMGER